MRISERFNDENSCRAASVGKHGRNLLTEATLKNMDQKVMTPAIGVFDSAFGRLTALQALVERLPSARFAFLGGIARLPYGSKWRRTIARFAAEGAQFNVNEQGAEFIVTACNTASALTLDANLPRMKEVRFLVDGQPRATLAGHADLTRTYLTNEDAVAAGGSRL
jgi:hypothetical protein